MTHTPLSRPSPSMPAAGSMSSKQIDPFKLLRKHWIALLASLLVGLVLGAIIHVAWSKTYSLYRAAAVFKYDAPKVRLGEQITNPSEKEIERFMNTHRVLMKSELVLTKAMRSSRLQNVAPNWYKRYMRNGTFAIPEAVEDLQKDLSIRVGSGTSYITMSLLWTDPKEVHGIVGLIHSSYIDEVESQNNRESSIDSSGLEQEIKDQNDRKARLQRTRDDMLKKSNASIIENRVSEESTNLTKIKSDVIDLISILEGQQVELANYESHVRSGTFPEQVVMMVQQDSQVMRLKVQVNELEAARIGMRERFLPGHRDLVRIESQLEGTRQQLAREETKQLREKLDSATEFSRTGVTQVTAQLNKLRVEESESETRLNDLEIVRAAVMDIERELEYVERQTQDRKDVLSDLQSRTQTDLGGRVSVAQSATVPTSPALPKAKIVVPGVAFLTVALVGGLIFLRETLDQRIHSAADVASSTRLRILGMIPHASRDRSASSNPSTVFIDEPTCAIAESFRHVRSSVLAQLSNRQSQSVLVVPCSSKAGATTVSINLAASLASTGMRVLLIDGNVRKPALHETLSLSRSPGLTEVLAGSATLDEAVQVPSNADGLSVLSAGTADRNAMELLSTPRAGELVEAAKRTYEVVIIDMPPPVVSGDAAALADNTDLMMFVVHAGQDTKGLLTRLRNEFAQKRATILGVVINKVQPEAGGYLMRNLLETQRYRESA